jgi:hypothetical protein
MVMLSFSRIKLDPTPKVGSAVGVFVDASAAVGVEPGDTEAFGGSKVAVGAGRVAEFAVAVAGGWAANQFLAWDSPRMASTTMIMAPALAAIIIGNGLIEGRGAVIVPGEVAAGSGVTVV